MEEVMCVMASDNPVMIAWNIHKESPEFINAKKWAVFPEHVEGSLWAVFVEAYKAGVWGSANSINSQLCQEVADKETQIIKLEQEVAALKTNNRATQGNDVVEKVARAICVQAFEDEGYSGQPNKEMWRNYRKQARAALSVINHEAKDALKAEVKNGK